MYCTFRAEKMYAYHKLLCHTAFKIDMQGDPTKPFIFNTSTKHKILLVETSLLKCCPLLSIDTLKQFLKTVFTRRVMSCVVPITSSWIVALSLELICVNLRVIVTPQKIKH